MQWRHPGNTKFNKQNISAERAAEGCFRQGWCTRSEERLSSRSMGSCQQDFMSLYPTLFNKDADSGESWKQELSTGLFYDLVRMTFWTNFSPCADPLPTQEAICIRLPWYVSPAQKEKCDDRTRAQDCADPTNSVDEFYRLYTSVGYETSSSQPGSCDPVISQ